MRSRALPDISVEEFQTYLQTKNWVSEGLVGTAAKVWHRNDSAEAEVVLPRSPDVKDYRERLIDALRSLAEYEGRDVHDVADDLVGAALNLMSVRVIGKDTADGSIPIEDGLLLIKKAKELLYAAAMAVYSKRRQFGGQPPRDAKAYMESLLLGQTEVGSYVVNVIAPSAPTPGVPPEETGGSDLSGLVAHSLVVGLGALAEASKRYQSTDDVGVFDRAVPLGVSANMCDALLGFSGKNQTRDFEIKVTAPTGPLFVRDTSTFSFDSRAVQTLEVASSYLKNDFVLLDREITGSVKHLHRPQVDEVGTVTVQAMVGETERNVQIQLGPEDYHMGVMAHDQKLAVRCRGDLHVKGRTTKLLNPQGFGIVLVPGLFP